MEIPTGFDAGLGERPEDLPPLDDVLAEINQAIWTGRLTPEEAQEAIKDYGKTQE